MKLEKIDRIKITESFKNDENDTGYFNRVNKHLFTKIQNQCLYSRLDKINKNTMNIHVKGAMDCSEDSSLKRAWNDVRELNSNEFKSLEKESIDFINQMC